MKTYAVNLVINKTDDIITLNKFPIVIKCKTEMELKEILSNDVSKYLQERTKTTHSFENAEWYIRSIYENDIREIVWKASELNTYS
jgi:hypothetical protein